MSWALLTDAHGTGSPHLGKMSKHGALGWLVHLGAIGLFGISFLDAWPFPLPVPGATDLLLLILIAQRQETWIVVPLAVAGAILGGLVTWSVGKKGGETALRRHVPERYYDRITGWVKHNGPLAVGVSALLPPPIPLMPFLVAAGALGIPKGRFTIAFGMGRWARYSLIAWLGLRYGKEMIHWWNEYLSGYARLIAWSLLTIFLAGTAWAIWKWWRATHHDRPQPVPS